MEKICEQTKELNEGDNEMLKAAEGPRLDINSCSVMLEFGQSDVMIYPAKFLFILLECVLRVLEKLHLASKCVFLYQI